MPQRRLQFANASYLPDRAASGTSLPAEAITGTFNNWQLRDGVARVSSGYVDSIAENTATNTLATTPTFATNLNFADEAEIIYLSDGTDNQFYKVVRNADDINNTVQTLNSNPATFNTGSVYDWASFEWGEVTVLHHPDFAPIYASAGSTNNNLLSIPNWRTADRTNYFIPLATTIIGLGYHGTTPNGNSFASDRVIIGSDQITTFNEFPTWEAGDDTNSTSAIYLIDGIVDGDLIAGERLQGFAVAYTDVASLRIEDNDDGTISLFPLFEDDGVLGRNAMCQIPNGHFVIGSHQVYTHDGSSKKVLGQDQWSDALFASINFERRNEVQAVYNPRSDTVWITVPRGATNKEVWVLNTKTGLIEEIKTVVNQNWFWFSSEGLPFNGVAGGEQYDEGRAYSNRVVSTGGTTTTSLFVHEIGTTYGGNAINADMVRSDILPIDGYANAQHSHAIFHMQGTGSISVSLGGHANSGVAPTYNRTGTVTSGMTNKFDARFTHPYFAYRLQSTSSGLSLASFDTYYTDKYRR